MKKPNDTTDPHKYSYSGYGFVFDCTGQFTHPDDGTLARNVIIFGVDLSNSGHATNRTQNTLILGEALVQKINDTTIYSEQAYSLKFSIENKTFFLSLHYNGSDSYLFVNGKQVIRFKPKTLKLKQTN